MIEFFIFVDIIGYSVIIAFSLIGIWICFKALEAFRGYRFIDKIRGIK